MTMLRLSTWVWLSLVGVVGFAMFQVKYQVMQVEDELNRVNRLIDGDRAEMRVLDAEWSFLNRAAWLDDLRRRYLTLAPISGSQIGSLDQIPFRASEQPASAGRTPAASHSRSVTLPGGPALVSVRQGARP